MEGKPGGTPGRLSDMTGFRLVLIGLWLVGAMGSAAEARQTPSQPRPERVDIDRLPINLGRIQRELKQSVEREDDQSGLRLRFQVEVFGRAPQIELFGPHDKLTSDAVPYGAPTHQQMLEMITPKEFRSPVMDFNSLFRWLAEKTK